MFSINRYCIHLNIPTTFLIIVKQSKSDKLIQWTFLITFGIFVISIKPKKWALRIIYTYSIHVLKIWLYVLELNICSELYLKNKTICYCLVHNLYNIQPLKMEVFHPIFDQIK